jgi:hypothetical protein
MQKNCHRLTRDLRMQLPLLAVKASTHKIALSDKFKLMLRKPGLSFASTQS